jgi:hypothetical protein
VGELAVIKGNNAYNREYQGGSGDIQGISREQRFLSEWR